MAAVFAVTLPGGIPALQAADNDNKDKDNQKNSAPRQAPPRSAPSSKPGNYGTPPAGPGNGPGVRSYDSKPNRPYNDPTVPRTEPKAPATPDTHTAPPTKDSVVTKPPVVTAPNTPTTPGTGRTTPGGNTSPFSGKSPGAGNMGASTAGPTLAPARVAPPPLKSIPTANGYTKVAPSGVVREKMEKRSDGEHIQHLTPTGKVATEVVKKPDGTERMTHYAPNGKVDKEVVVNRDGTKAITTHQLGRDGTPRVQETVTVNSRGAPVSKTVVVKNNVIVNNTTIINNNTTVINNTTVVKNYHYGHYGYVYRPDYVVIRPFVVSWYDPFWYTPAGVVIFHPFRFSWGWDDYGWYRCHHHYWHTYEVYPAPSYWVTDWVIAGYVADRYAASMDAAQAHEEARLAREEAEKAMQVAQQAKDAAEIAEAHRAREEAEARAAKAEARAAKAEVEEAKTKALAGQPNPNATPIDDKTKEALKDQIEKEIALKKKNAEAATSRKAVVPDLSVALADPKHIYPVSKAINVISAKDQSPAGALTELAYALAKLGRPDDAYEKVKRATELDTNSAAKPLARVLGSSLGWAIEARIR